MPIHHLTLATEGRHVLFPDEPSVRQAIHTLIRVSGREILLFSLVDDHIHVVIEHENPGQRGRALRLALRAIAAAPLDSARPRPVEGRDHLVRLISYLFGQARHHGMEDHPALSLSSCAADLLGYRRLPGLAHRLWTWLPRWRPTEVARLLGLKPEEFQPAPLDLARDLGSRRIILAAAFVACAPPDLIGSSGPVLQARASAVQLAVRAGLPRIAMAEALGIPRQTVHRLLGMEPREEDMDAILRRLTVEEAVLKSRVTARVGFSGTPSKV